MQQGKNKSTFGRRRIGLIKAICPLHLQFRKALFLDRHANRSGFVIMVYIPHQPPEEAGINAISYPGYHRATLTLFFQFYVSKKFPFA
jgi:hypothetical protein